jgi:hypothetical protein
MAATNGCPVCGGEENNIHVWSCKGHGMYDIYQTKILEVYSWMTQGPPILHDFVIHLLALVRGDMPSHVLPEGPYASVLQDQLNLGIFSFLWGYHTTDIVSMTEEFFKESRKSGAKWLAILVLRLWTVYEQLWAYRNRCKHDEAYTSSNNGQELAAINSEIDTIYLQIPNRRLLRNVERQIFKLSREEIKTKKTMKQKKGGLEMRIYY